MLSQYFVPLNKNLIHFILSLGTSEIIQIVLIVLLALLFYKKFIEHTNSEKFVRSILILFFFWILSECLGLLQLNILGVFIKSIVTLISISLVIIFQPELRRFLGYLGQPGFISKAIWGVNSRKKNEEIDVIKEILDAVRYLTKTKTGALIVLQNDLSPVASDSGVKINADVSSELILTIFYPNTPLHDGAVIIKDSKIFKAGALLPITKNPELGWRHGTRHRAALGLTEVNSSACLVVSEETGEVSIAMSGSLKKYDDLVTLKEDLENILKIPEEDDESKKTNFFDFKSKMKNKDE